MNPIQRQRNLASKLPLVFERIATILVLPTIVILVTVDVCIRTSGAGSLSWSHELLGLLLLVFFLLGLPYTALRNDLIQVDLASRLIPPAGIIWINRLSSVFSATIGALLTYQGAVAGYDMYAYGDSMVTLPVPLWPVAFIVSFLAATWTISQIFQVFQPRTANSST